MKKTAIDYNAINEQYGEVSVSDQEDEIEQTVRDNKNSRRATGKKTALVSKQVNKYDRAIKSGFTQNGEVDFSNFFTSQKVRAKISAGEEEEGKKLFLKSEPKNNQKKQTAVKRGKNRKQKESDSEDISGYENEDRTLTMHHNKKVEDIDDSENKPSSKNTKHFEEKDRLLEVKNWMPVFEQVDYYLDIGFNVLVHGVGSKAPILKDYGEEFYTKKYRNWKEVHSYMGQFTMKNLVAELRAYIEKTFQTKHQRLAKNANIADSIEWMRNEAKELKDDDKDLVCLIIVHSFDIGCLKQNENVEMLAELASVKAFKFIFAIDHIKSTSVLWSDHALDQFNFVSVKMDTFIPFTREGGEFEHMPSLFSVKNDNQEIGLSFILKSMTKNQIDIIKVIAKRQLKKPEEKGISMADLMSKCVDKMLAHSQHQLKGYLAEAKDHKVVVERQDAQGSTFLYMTYPSILLEKIVQDKLDE